jgi:hypothetical protein
MQLTNGVEVLQFSQDANDYVEFNAVTTDTWAGGAFLYHDGTNLKKYAPADTTAHFTLQPKLIGIASAGKKTGENKAIVCLKATVLMDSTALGVGVDMVIKYTVATDKYTAYQGALYNTDFNPDITLAGAFCVGLAAAEESDYRGKFAISGSAHLAAL